MEAAIYRGFSTMLMNRLLVFYLELGCGDGCLAQLFVQRGLQYCEEDISSKMVTMAERRIGESGLKAQFMVADVDQMTFSEPLDAVVSYMRISSPTFVVH